MDERTEALEGVKAANRTMKEAMRRGIRNGVQAQALALKIRKAREAGVAEHTITRTLFG